MKILNVVVGGSGVVPPKIVAYLTYFRQMAVTANLRKHVTAYLNAEWRGNARLADSTARDVRKALTLVSSILKDSRQSHPRCKQTGFSLTFDVMGALNDTSVTGKLLFLLNVTL